MILDSDCIDIRMRISMIPNGFSCAQGQENATFRLASSKNPRRSSPTCGIAMVCHSGRLGMVFGYRRVGLRVRNCLLTHKQ